jgi:Protein of unknown function/AsmA-like C-terminal region
MKRRAGQAARIFGEAVHQLGRMAMLLVVLVLLAVCVLGFRLSFGPIQIPKLASWLATAASGQGISIRMREADLAWAGYHQGGGVPLYLRLGDIEVRNAVGVELVSIPSAKLVVLPAALFGSGAPIVVSGTDARFPGSNVAVSLLAAIHLGPGFSRSSADMAVTLGAGGLGIGKNSVPITAGRFYLAVTPRAALLTDGYLALAHVGGSTPKLAFNGVARLTDVWRGGLDVTADAVQAQDLGAYWPPGALPQTRKWVLRNITGGEAENAAFSFGLEAPGDLASLRLSDASGHFKGQDITLTWIPRAAPITGLDGEFTMLDRDKAVITGDTAKLGKLELSGGRLVITGMDTRLQVGQLSLRVDGSLGDVIGVLDAPPLNLLRKAPPQLASVTGQADATVTAKIPFITKVRLADVDLHVGAKLSQVGLATSVEGLDFSSGELSLDATADGLALKGQAQFAGEPATLAVTSRFLAGGDASTLVMDSQAGPLLLRELGLDKASAFAGPVVGSVPYGLRVTGDSAGVEDASLDADLGPAAFSVPVFGWRKPAGAAGHLALTATLEQGVPVSLDSVAASAPELDVQGRREGRVLVVSKADIGRTEASGVVIPPAGPQAAWTAAFTGPILDLRPFPQGGQVAQEPGQSAPAPAPAPQGKAPAVPWVLKLNFPQLDLAPSPAPDLAGLTFAGSGQGDTLMRGQGAAAGIAVIVAPSAPERWHLTMQAPDGGLLLRALDLYEAMQGGAVSLDATYGDDEPVTGTLSLANFRMLKAPVITKILQGFTLYGVGEATSGPGLLFDRAVVPFSINHQTLRLDGARAFSASLGFTASGNITLANAEANLDATIVPAYLLNTLPGKIPLVGHLFTAEKGGGLIAIRAKITGPLGNPKVQLNPLSALTPGVLRGIFGLGAGSK